MVEFFNLAQIILIDLSLAGDNALVIGMAVTALPKGQRKKAMIFGIAGATILRIIMAFFAVELLQVTGLLLAGGLLLLWVGWKMEREIRHAKTARGKEKTAKSTREAVWQILIADVSMSLDNVLGVAGVARDHMRDLVIGLGLSILLMGLASSVIARLTEKYPKIAYIGVAIILYTAGSMIWDGAKEVHWLG